MDSDDSEDIEDLLSTILDLRYPPLRKYSGCSPSPTASPVSFYDKHIDESRTLKRVKPLSSLVQTLGEGVDKAFEAFYDRGRTFPTKGIYVLDYEAIENRRLMQDASSVGDLYAASIAQPCAQVASMLALHPDIRGSKTAFVWRRKESPFYGSFSLDIYGLWMRPTDNDGMKRLLAVSDEMTRRTILDLTKNMPRLAVWDCYALQGEQMIRSMEDLTTLDTFPWQAYHTNGHIQSAPLGPPPDADASATFWTVPPLDGEQISTHIVPSITASTPRRSQRLKTLQASARHPLPQATSRRAKRVYREGEGVKPSKITGSRRGGKLAYRPDPADFLQHAWAKAVDADSTIIVFDCGSSQRVGIRHRESQTLYLSDLISPQACEGIRYGKLQVGIHLAIVQDAISRLHKSNRTEDIDEEPQDTPTTRKRRRDTSASDESEHKKRKLDSEVDDAKDIILSGVSGVSDDTMREYAPTTLLLLYLKYRSYNSPSPASLIRAGPMLFPGQHHDAPTPKPKAKTSYSSHEYLTLTLGPEIGFGAVGTVHKGELQRRMPDGRVVACGVVVKLAFLPEEQEKLFHEYTVYHRLFSSDVKVLGLVHIFGLFVDTEGGPSALVMSDGGKPLGYRQDNKGQVVVPPDERKAFLDVLETIHHAGILHGDLRAWNLLVADNGDVSIIDFDSAEFDAPDKHYNAEERVMISLLDGKFVHP